MIDSDITLLSIMVLESDELRSLKKFTIALSYAEKNGLVLEKMPGCIAPHLTLDAHLT